MTVEHDWEWAGHGTRPLFGNPDNLEVVDYWVCKACGKSVTLRGSAEGPADGRCTGGTND